jgi:hypothetical protein
MVQTARDSAPQVKMAEPPRGASQIADAEFAELSVEEALRRLDSDAATGLSEGEATRRAVSDQFGLSRVAAACSFRRCVIPSVISTARPR